MRQLFLPACICLVTWSGATSSDAGLTLDEFASKRHTAGTIAIPEEETARAVVAIPRVDEPSPKAETPVPDLAELTALVPDLAAEYPVPSGVVINNGIPIGIPLPPRPKPVVDRSEDEICHALTTAAQQNDVPAPFFIRLLFQESRFRPEVVSIAGAQGVAQFMPQTAEQMGLENPFDPVQAIPASARLLRDLVSQFGNLGLAAAAYNAGPKRVADWLAAKGKTKLPEETQGYVKIITGKPVEHWSAASARHPAQKLPQEAPCQSAAGLLAAAGPDEVPLPVGSPLRASVKVADNKTGDKKSGKSEAKAEAKTAETGAKAKAKDQAKDQAKSEPRKDTPKREKIAQR
ncbi:MAG TPA: lytic transglycosylase domain-containing protein [Pseudolabrys sp.]|nr:lytic transglycosylase domain-containing protein [Pseudolabrys sp.]